MILVGSDIGPCGFTRTLRVPCEAYIALPILLCACTYSAKLLRFIELSVETLTFPFFPYILYFPPHKAWSEPLILGLPHFVIAAFTLPVVVQPFDTLSFVQRAEIQKTDKSFALDHPVDHKGCGRVARLDQNVMRLNKSRRKLHSVLAQALVESENRLFAWRLIVHQNQQAPVVTHLVNMTPFDYHLPRQTPVSTQISIHVCCSIRQMSPFLFIFNSKIIQYISTFIIS